MDPLELIDRLWRAIAEVADLCEDAGISVVLGGGLAIHAEVVPQTWEDWDPPDLHDPRRLATLARATDDADLFVPDACYPSVRQMLLGLGYRVDPSVPHRYMRGAIQIDLIRSAQGAEFASASHDVHLCDTSATRPLRLPTTTIMLAAPAQLLVHKARAYRDRHARKDLVDVASIAIRCLPSAEQVTYALEAMLRSLPLRVESDVRYLAARFRTADGEGPAAFAEVARAAAGPLSEWESAEDSVREVVSSAVRRVLAPWTV